METPRVLTSLLVLTLTGVTLGYPYNTRGVASRSSARARDRQVLDGNLADYLGGYVQDTQYALPEYQPTYRQEYAPQRQRINAEAIAALLPYLTNNNDDYAYDYNSYSDDDGTWYDYEANEDGADTADSDNAALLQFLINHRSGRYSLEDLETLEREAEMEDNTENQLHQLMAKKMNKKSSLPPLGARRIAVGTPLAVRKGQKEEALDIPSTSIRRPVFARQIATEPEQTEPETKRCSETGTDNSNSDSSSTSSDSSSSSGISSSSTQGRSAPAADAASVPAEQVAPVSISNPAAAAAAAAASDADVVSSSDVAKTTMTPYMQSKYEALMKYLDRERKVRQNQDIEQELQQETLRPQPQKRFVTETESLPEQLANLKKTVA